MNLRWFRNHLISLIGGTVFIVLLAVMIWFLHDAYTQQDSVLEDLSAQNSALDGLRGEKTFPSKENIELLKQDRVNIQALYDDMRESATHPHLHGPELIRDVDFRKFQEATVNRLAKAAAVQGIHAPEMFGFSRYDANFPCRNPRAADDECRRLLALLSKQLVTVEKLVNLMITNKVEEILAIRRTEVEPGEVSADALNVPINNNSNSLYQTYPFELQFMCDTSVLRDLLNGLMQTDGLFVIRALKIDSTAVKLKSLDMPSATGELSTPNALKPVEQPTGEVRTRRLNVTLRLDLVEFAAANPAKPRSARE